MALQITDGQVTFSGALRESLTHLKHASDELAKTLATLERIEQENIKQTSWQREIYEQLESVRDNLQEVRSQYNVSAAPERISVDH